MSLAQVMSQNCPVPGMTRAEHATKAVLARKHLLACYRETAQKIWEGTGA